MKNLIPALETKGDESVQAGTGTQPSARENNVILGEATSSVSQCAG